MTKSPEKDDEQTLEALVAEAEARPIVAKVLKLLSKEIDSAYSFHSLEHTRDVLREALQFALFDGRSPRELELLGIAAAYHDVGFVEGAEGHEQRGADFAAEAMEEEGCYSEDEVVLVQRMILDTHLNETHAGMKQKATTELSGYLLDADLSNFGRADFFERLGKYVEELGSDEMELAKRTHELMRHHEWKTPAAKTLRDQKKQENLKKLADQIR